MFIDDMIGAWLDFFVLNFYAPIQIFVIFPIAMQYNLIFTYSHPEVSFVFQQLTRYEILSV
jgi:hypothetical protein